MLDRTENRRVAYKLAVAQHGVVSRVQLLEARLSSGLVQYWLETGRLIRVVSGVYALGRPVVRDESIWMAGILIAGPSGVLIGQTAAAALGFGEPPATVEVARNIGRQRRVRAYHPHRPAVFLIRRGSFRDGDIGRVGPIPVTSVDRTLTDLAARLNDWELRRRFLEAGRMGLLTTECLARIDSCPRRYKGRGRLRTLGSRWDPSKGPLRSILESEFRLMCAEQDLPIPLSNYPVGVFEVDAIWLEAKLVVELDGRKFHSDPFALTDDSAKTRALRAMGYTVLRFTWKQITGNPEWVAAEIRRALARLAPGLLARR